MKLKFRSWKKFVTDWKWYETIDVWLVAALEQKIVVLITCIMFYHHFEYKQPSNKAA